MARIPAEDTTGDTTETDTETDDDGGRPVPDERMEDIGTAPDDDPEPEPEPDPAPDPTDQPARGRDPDSGTGRGSGGTGDVGETEPEDDPTDQPARGADPDSGDGMGSGDPDPDPDPPPDTDQPTRGGGTTPATDPEDVTETETVDPEDLQTTETFDVGEFTEDEFAIGQGIETEDAPTPMATGEMSGDELSVEETERLFEQATGEELETADQLEDVSFRRVGDTVAVFAAGQGERGATAFAADRFESDVADELGVDPSDIAVQERDGDLVAVPTEDYLTEQAAGQLSDREGVVGVEKGDGEVTATFQPTQEEIAAEFEDMAGTEQVYVRGSEGDPVTVVQGLTDEEIDALNRSISAEMDEQVGEGVRDVSAAREAVERERTREEFGDVPIQIPDEVTVGTEYEGPTGTTAPPGARGGRLRERTVDVPGGGERVEDVLQGASDFIQEGAEDVGIGVSGGYGELLSQAIRGEEVDVDEALASAEETRSAEAEAFGDVVTGAGAITDVPGVALTAKEAGEYVGYAGGEVAEGELDELTEETSAAAQQRVSAFAEYAQENPAEVAGLGVGSLAGSAAIMGGAARVSSRAGTISRYAIQPGEELAGTAGFRATRALRGETTAQRLFPNREPLIFSEEAVLRAGSDLAERIRNVRGELTGELQGTARQQELIDLGRPEGPTGTLSVEGEIETRPVPAGPSEPLGSPTEDIVDASLRGGGSAEVAELETEATTETETQRQGITEEMEQLAGEATGRQQLQQAAERLPSAEEFLGDTRAQSSLIGGRTRGVGKSEVRRTDDRLTANLYQQSVARQVETEYEALQDTIESPEYRFEGRGTESRLRQAQDPEARVETETDTARRTELRVDPFVGEDVRPDTFADIRPDIDAAARPDVRTEIAAAEVAVPELRQELQTEVAAETETAFETELEFEPAETEFEFEPRPETRTRPPREAEAERDPEEEEPEEDRGPLDLAIFEEQFGTGIAGVEDLVEGE